MHWNRRAFALAPLVALVAALCTPAPCWGQQKEKGDKRQADRDAIRDLAGKYMEGYAKGDAKQLAGLWTKDGEHVSAAGETTRGRAALEKFLAESFKNLSGTLDIKSDSLRFLSRDTALEEGTLRVTKKGEKNPVYSVRYSALFVREDGQWRVALVRDTEEGNAVASKLQDLEWLVGSWSYQGKDGEVRLRYEWAENKAFLHGHFQSRKGDKVMAAGLIIIGRDPVADVLRSWVFNSDGSYGHSLWLQEGNRWSLDSKSKLVTGSVSSSTNLITKLSDDAFTFQSVNRRLDDMAQPDTAPVKVTRVKGGK